jgi:general secretion pathway protein I
VTRRPPAAQALSLLEVLLALAIMLLALVAIGRLVDVGMDRALDAQLQTRATLLAESKLAEVETGAVAIRGGSSGVFDDAPEWSWVVESQPAAWANLYQVTVRVYRTYQDRPVAVELHQLLLDPAVIGSSAQAEAPAPATSSGTASSSNPSRTGGTMP